MTAQRPTYTVTLRRRSHEIVTAGETVEWFDLIPEGSEKPAVSRPSEAAARKAAELYGWSVEGSVTEQETYRVLIYGSRTWLDHGPIRAFVDSLPSDCTVVTGGAAGADHIGFLAARARGLHCEVYPADWKTHGRRAGPIRNQEMLDHGLTLARGFRVDGESRGTDDMTERLVRAGVPHQVVPAAPQAGLTDEGAE